MLQAISNFVLVGLVTSYRYNQLIRHIHIIIDKAISQRTYLVSFSYLHLLLTRKLIINFSFQSVSNT
jgi:hypothetical protein